MATHVSTYVTTVAVFGMSPSGYRSVQSIRSMYVVTDISGSDSQHAEQAALMRLRDAGAATANWIMLGSELLNSWDTPQGKALGQIYATHINGPNTSVYGNTINDVVVGDES